MRRVLLRAALGGTALLAILASAAMAGQAAMPQGPVYPAANPKGSFVKMNALPDWGGAWVVAPQRRAAGEPAPPAPKPKGKFLEQYNRMKVMADQANGEWPRVVNNCTTPGVPYSNSLGQYPIEFLFTPGRVTVLYEAWTGQRRIFTDGRPWIPEDEVELSFFGDSRGRWEGDVLVAETRNLKGSNQIANGVFVSPKTVLHERIYLDQATGQLVNEMTVVDPDVLEEPYKQTVRYNRRRDIDLIEFVCAENDRNPLQDDGRIGFTVGGQ